MTGGGVRLTHASGVFTYIILLSHIHTDSSFDSTNRSTARFYFSSIGPRSLHFDFTRFRDRTFYIFIIVNKHIHFITKTHSPVEVRDYIACSPCVNPNSTINHHLATNGRSPETTVCINLSKLRLKVLKTNRFDTDELPL